MWSNLLGNDSILLAEPVDAIIRLSHPPDGTTDGVGGGLASHPTSGLIDLGNVQLDGSVVLGRDDAVASGAANKVHHEISQSSSQKRL